jgi:hypothetical protein
MKDKIVHPDLQAERDGACFDNDELKTFLMGGAETRKEAEDFRALIENEPLLKPSHKWFDMTREEKMEQMYKRMERLYQIDKEKYYLKYEQKTNFSYTWLLQGLVSSLFK